MGTTFTLASGSRARPLSLAGFSVRLTIPIETSKGAVTAVPTSALWLAATEHRACWSIAAERLEYVTVQPGLSAGGYVEVTALDGRLVPGEFVVVGYQTPS